MKKNINEELTRMKYLFGYEKGVVISEQRLVLEQVTGETQNSNAVDITGDINTIKTAIQTLNSEISSKTGSDPGLFLSISAKGMPAVGPYITIINEGLQTSAGTNRPFGYMGIDLGSGKYGIGKGSFGTGQIQTSPKVEDAAWLKVSITNGISKTLGGGDKGVKYSQKYGGQILTASQTFFNTVDPIFKKLMTYKGYDFTRNDGQEYVIGKSQPLA
jgi:hypothetical protein